MRMKNLYIILLLLLAGVGFSGCAHQSAVIPSKGHIDGQPNPSQTNVTGTEDIPKPVKTTAYLPPPKAKVKEQKQKQKQKQSKCKSKRKNKSKSTSTSKGKSKSKDKGKTM